MAWLKPCPSESEEAEYQSLNIATKWEVPLPMSVAIPVIN
jgi:hypothetical protein